MQLPVTVGDRVEMREARQVLGVWCREGTMDDFVAREIEKTYGWMDVAGRRVLDIGGNIGAYARWAIDHGASYIWSVEPEESNYTCLLRNMARTEEIEPGCVIRSTRAAIGATDGTTQIWLSPTGKNPGNTSSVHYRGRVSQGGIEQVAFSRIMREMQPEVLKVDVEGAEYEFFDPNLLPACCFQVTMEIHLSRPDWREHLGPQTANNFRVGGWDCVREPKFEGGHWQTIGAWRR